MKLKEILDSQSDDDVWEILNAGKVLYTLDKEYDKWESYSRGFNIPVSMFSDEMRNESREALETLPQEVLETFITLKWQNKFHTLINYLRED